ncbi:MAG: hypothetical protein ACREDM_10195 [Methylocella sp.]
MDWENPNRTACLMTFLAEEARRNRWERVAALAAAARAGSRNRWPPSVGDAGPSERWIALVFSFGPNGYPARMTSAEKMKQDTIGVDISKVRLDACHLAEPAVYQ